MLFGATLHGVVGDEVLRRIGLLELPPNPSDVRVCPCNLRGKPLGPVTEARARIVPESEADHASSIVASNWSTPMR
jgi:hypothetical protein